MVRTPEIVFLRMVTAVFVSAHPPIFAAAVGRFGFPSCSLQVNLLSFSVSIADKNCVNVST